MKTLLTTTAVLLATASIASASPTGAAPTTDIDGSPLTSATGEIVIIVPPIDGTSAKIQQIIADNSGYDSYGDVWSTFGYQGGPDPAPVKKYKDHSYDQGITNVNFTNSTANNVNVRGKYHDFNISTDVELVSGTSNKLAFMGVIEQVKNVSYNEGYRDGFNDGYEKGFYDGKQSILNQLK